MAKGNLFLGQAKGKVGSIVFSRAFGKQITRTKPASVANPKTIGQNTQRAILATIAKEAALLTPIVDHSFANIKYGADSVRYFRKINLGILRNSVMSSVGTNYNLTAKGGLAVPNYLKVSEGNLPAFTSSVDEDNIAFYGSNTPLSAGDDITVSDFKLSYPNIQGGDQITLVKIVKIAGSLADNDASFALKVDRVVFAPNAFDDNNAKVFDGGDLNQNLLDLTKTTNTTMLSNVDGGAGHGIGFQTNVDNTYAAALILSRKVNGKWQRSTQFMELCEFKDSADNAAAIASYGATISVSDATEYLNQAEEGEAQSGIRGAYMSVTTKMTGADANIDTVGAGETGSSSYEGASGTMVSISAQAYAPSGGRVVSVEVDRPNGSYAAHGAKSVNYDVAITAATTGNWKVVALFDDGSRAEYTITLALQA